VGLPEGVNDCVSSRDGVIVCVDETVLEVEGVIDGVGVLVLEGDTDGVIVFEDETDSMSVLEGVSVNVLELEGVIVGVTVFVGLPVAVRDLV
jgi:hypothetical protein